MNTQNTSELTTEFSGMMQSWLFVYAILFVIGIAFMALYRKKTNIEKSRATFAFILLSVVSLLVKLLFSTNGWEFQTDINCFTSWSATASNGLFSFYEQANFCDYPPLYIYILGIFGAFTKIGLPAIISVRLPALICEIVIAVFIYKFVTKKIGNVAGVILSVLWLFNPLCVLDCAIWGQMDAVLTCFAVVALYFLDEEKYIPSAIFFTASVLIKPQGLFFIPIFIFVIIKRRHWINLLWGALIALGLTMIVILPFAKTSYSLADSSFITTLSSYGGRDLWMSLASLPIIRDFFWLADLYLGTAGTYNYTSLNMANVYSIFGLNLSQDSELLGGLSYATWGICFIIAVVVITFVYIMKTKNDNYVWISAAFMNVGIVMLATRMHERYMFPVVALLFIVFIFTHDWITPLLALGFTITNYLNVSDVLIRNIALNYPHIDPTSPLLIATSITNTILFGILLVLLVYNTFAKRPLLGMHKLGVLQERKPRQNNTIRAKKK